MQFNRPINSGFQNDQFYPYFPQPLPYKDIIGEGNVVPLMFPDGTTQLYFIPTYVQDRRFYPYHSPNVQSQWPVGTEAWFIRKISSPAIPHAIQENIPNGDPFLRSYYASKGNIDLIPQTPYYQKFHSDNVTSTTDIHYFFPLKTTLKHSVFVQAEHPAKYNVSSETEHVNGICFCLKKNKSKCEQKVIDSSSAMSFDNKTQTRQRQKKNTKVRFKPHTSKERKLCTCKQMYDQHSRDKKISTYTDQSTTCASASSQDSQTLRQESKHSSKPIVSKSNSQMSCDSCCGTCFYCITDCTSECCE